MNDDLDQCLIAGRKIAAKVAEIPSVLKISLIGSIAKAVIERQQEEGDNLSKSERFKDFDLAIWVTDMKDLRLIEKAIGQGLRVGSDERGTGIGGSEVDTFLIEPYTNKFLGFLCKYNQCPKPSVGFAGKKTKKKDCLLNGCGDPAFLKQFPGFCFFPDALNENRIVSLYELQPLNQNDPPISPVFDLKDMLKDTDLNKVINMLTGVYNASDKAKKVLLQDLEAEGLGEFIPQKKGNLLVY